MKMTFVILDCYDESTFERCMQSVGLQSMDDYEVLVVGARQTSEITAGDITAKYINCEDDICAMLETLVLAVISFAATNMDDLLMNVFLFAGCAPRKRFMPVDMGF